LGVEKLEDRQLMAGIVNILISATEIRFVGDAANNGISVTFQGNSGSNTLLRVSSVNTGSAGDTGTQFRVGTTGPTFSTINLPAVPNTIDLTIQSEDGDDRVVFNQSAPASNTAIQFRDANLDLGFGAKDSLDVTYLRVSQDLKIWGGQDVASAVPVQAPVITLGRGGPIFVGRHFGYLGGNGNDDITIINTTIIDHVGLSPPETNWRAAVDLSRSMETRDGNDRVIVTNAPGGPVIIGATRTTQAESSFWLLTGNGNDTVSSTGMTSNHVLWDLGAGDDTVYFQSTTIKLDSQVDGGAGYDIHTESNVTPKNNFIPLLPTPTVPNPPFADPAVVEVRFLNFENGQTRPPSSGGGSGGGGGGGGTGRWVFRNQGLVTVNTSASPVLNGLEQLLLATSQTHSGNEPSATIVDGKLLINGTAASESIFVSEVVNGLVRVRVGNKLLGIFSVENGMAIDGVDGDDYIYVAPSSTTTVVSATPGSDRVTGGSNVLLMNSSSVYTTGEAAAAVTASSPGAMTAQDLALLALLYGGSYSGGSGGGSSGSGGDDGDGGFR